jgi:hypothetical protein
MHIDLKERGTTLVGRGVICQYWEYAAASGQRWGRERRQTQIVLPKSGAKGAKIEQKLAFSWTSHDAVRGDFTLDIVILLLV